MACLIGLSIRICMNRCNLSLFPAAPVRREGQTMPIGSVRPFVSVWSVAPLLVASLIPTSATAQSLTAVGGDAALRSTYLWRGITRTSGWVLQPDLFASTAFQAFTVTAGWWSTIELGSPDPNDPTNSSLGSTWFGQSDLWLEFAKRLGPTNLAAGITRYLYDADAFGQSADAVNSTELYADVWHSSGPVVPRLSVWFDIDRVRGVYTETGIDLRVPILPSYDPVVSVYLGALAGWNWGQEVNAEKPEEPAYFSERGLTHVDLSLLVMGGHEQRYATLELHYVFARDGGARPPGSTASESRWWLGLALSDAAIFGEMP
jgi:hypothetical protein